MDLIHPEQNVTIQSTLSNPDNRLTVLRPFYISKKKTSTYFEMQLV